MTLSAFAKLLDLFCCDIILCQFISNKTSPFSRVSPTAVPPLHTLREPTASASRGATLSTRIDRDISLLVPLRFVRQLRTQTAQSLVLFVKLGVRFSRRPAARVPSANWHIPFISTP